MVATFQSTVQQFQPSGIVGEIILSGPRRASPQILASTSAANNVIGRAFRHVGTNDLNVTADATGVFAGILVHPKSYATSGPATGTLDPTLALPNNTIVEVLSMGIIIVDLSQDSPTAPRRNIGDNVWFEDATGVLVGVNSATTTVASYTQVPNATIVRNNVDGDPGLAIIQLTN